MATSEELKAKWITEYEPTQADYAELFDFIEEKGTIPESPYKQFSINSSIGDFDREGITPTPEARFEIVGAPGAEKVIVLERVLIAIQLDDFNITSAGTVNTLPINLYQRGVRIGVVYVAQNNVLFGGNNFQIFEITFDYDPNGNSLRSMTNANVELSFEGRGTPDRGTDGKMNYKITGTYQVVDTFPYSSN